MNLRPKRLALEPPAAMVSSSEVLGSPIRGDILALTPEKLVKEILRQKPLAGNEPHPEGGNEKIQGSRKDKKPNLPALPPEWWQDRHVSRSAGNDREEVVDRARDRSKMDGGHCHTKSHNEEPNA